MSFLDIILGLMLFWGVVKGFKNGLLVEIASIIAIIAGIYGAIHFSYYAGDYLSQHMEWEERYVNIAAFVITFLAIVFIVHIAARLLTKIANLAMLGLLNKIAGAIFGALKVAIILGALLIFFERVNESADVVENETMNRSVLYRPLKEIGAFVFNRVLRTTEEVRPNNNPEIII
ncbi:CvpA family protein [Pareuzebyella sediminis]|uniref:CvpA family protein n=1 Tax=Pareuzebyella sediminis TaxID=2607998 RepID=UPI0011EBAD87|nr:CvpA family protein [Pareuzebyella sediminis]